MTKKIRIELPDEYDDGEIEEYFFAATEELQSAFDAYSFIPDSDRVQIDEISITEVCISENSINIQYEVDYSAHYGCSNIDFVKTKTCSLTGTRNGNLFLFDEKEPPPKRSTYEEY